MSLLPLFPPQQPPTLPRCYYYTMLCAVLRWGEGEGNRGYTGGTHHAHKQRRRRERKRKGGRTATKSFFQALWEEKRKEGNDWPACPVRPAMLLLPRADGRSDELFWSSFFFFGHARRRNHQKFLVCWGGSRRRFLVLHKVGRRSDGRLRRRSPPATRGTDRRRRRRHMLCVHWAVDMVGDVDDCWEEESE